MARDDGVELPEIALCQRPTADLGHVLQLRRPARSPQRDVGPAIQDPAHSQSQHVAIVVTLGPGIERRHRLQIVGVVLRFELGVDVAEVIP